MKPIFAAAMTYNENLFYNRALAGTAEKVVAAKKFMVGGLEVMDYVMGAIAFGAYFLASSGVEMETGNQIFQGVIAVVLFLTVLKSLNRMKRSTASTSKSETVLTRTAKSDLASSGQDGESLEVTFFEDSFQIESPGIVAEYQYEGVTHIRETEEYLMISCGKETVVPVEKAGIYEGTAEILRAFLEKKCKMTVEMVNKS